MDDMAMVGLGVDSRPVRQATGDLDKFAKSGDQAGGSAGGVTKSAAAMSAGMRRASSAIGAAVAGLAALSGSIRVLSSFERQMSALGAVSRATADEMAAMRSIAAELGSTTEFTATQAGEHGCRAARHRHVLCRSCGVGAGDRNVGCRRSDWCAVGRRYPR